MKTILAEKPSVAKVIASLVGASNRKDGFFEGNGYQVTWAIGHLVGLSMPDAYGYENWSLDHLPIIPEPFQLEVTNDPSIKKQFKIVKALFHDTDEIIVATDAAREGELIFRYINTLANTPKNIPIKRAWFSSATDEGIQKALAELRSITDYDRLYFAAKARSEADWLVGINFTQGYTLASKKSKALSIGRVQTPTLKLVVDRFNENKGFTSRPFFVPKILLEDKNTPLELSCEEKFGKKEAAEQLLLGLEGTLSPEIVREDKTTSEKPPLPYDLTALQRDGNRLYRLTAKQTLDITQALYEKHKLVTYPRTDSEYLPQVMDQEVAQVFKKLSGVDINGISTESLKQTALKNIPGNEVFNDKKIEDHHGIIPTGINTDLQNLTEDERNVYLLIVKRFYQCFLDECTKDIRRLSLSLQDHVFSATQTQISSVGWRILSPEPEKDAPLPTTEAGERRTILETVVHEGATKPKPLFTDSSLIGLMQTAGKMVSEKQTRDALKEKGLGASSTRAAIIETLIQRGYMVREKSKLIPTELGIGLIASLGELSLCSPEMTGEWEYRLRLVERNELSYESFMHEIKAYVRTMLPKVVKAAQEVVDVRTPEERARNFSLGNCPKCGNGEIRKGKKSYYCSNWNQEPKCDFTIWNTSFNKKLNDSIVTTLITKGSTKKLKGFKSKTGKPYEAKLILDENKRLKLSFD
ncbi:DNA topoisomerase III [Flagellimonas sp.]|uniref:type IA DNA topoisomerase n=1 Tax=Flagellimonas sp. TaxID=2058762 RepID=UPI003BAD58DD